MTSIQRTTWLLLVLVILTAFVDGVAHLSDFGPTAIQHPGLPSFDEAAADRITLGRTDDVVVLERKADGWWIVAPIAGRANQDAVQSLLDALSAGVAPEAGVGEEDRERYGLAGGNELRVDVQGEGVTLATLYVGHDAGAGSTWVRWGGGDAIYRARIGGRATFDRGARAWRDLDVTSLDPRNLQRVVVRTENRTFTWIPDGQGGWRDRRRPLDVPTLTRAVQALARLHALEVAVPAYAEGSLVVELIGPNDTTRLAFEAIGELWFVSRADRDERWRVAPELPALLVAAPDSLLDRHLWGPIQAAAVRIEQRIERERAALELSDEAGWVRTTPTPLDVDPKRAQAAATWLRGPRVARWAEEPPRELGFPGSESWQVRFDNRRIRTLELGGRALIDGMEHVAVRDRRQSNKVGWVDARVVSGIQRLFSD